MSCHGEVGISRGHHIKDTRLEIDILHGQQFLAECPGRLSCHAAAAALTAGDALTAGAASHAELQVLLLREGARHLLGCPDGEGELTAGLTDSDGGADVLRLDFYMLPGTALPDNQAAPTRPLAPVHRAILKGCWEVVYLSLVDLLVDAFLHVLEDDGELQRADQRGFDLAGCESGSHVPTQSTSYLGEGKADHTHLPH
uniref:Uncharacterized protein n=1 Tax=Accipiter nisus TaxID=211598 RepID=A0A8B9MMU9_9AVES